MTENNLGNIKPGDEVSDRARRDARRSVEGPGSQRRHRHQSRQASSTRHVAQVQNSRDWLRQAQRFPVAVEFDPSERERLRGVRIGGQADVLVYTGDHSFMNDADRQS